MKLILAYRILGISTGTSIWRVCIFCRSRSNSYKNHNTLKAIIGITPFRSCKFYFRLVCILQRLDKKCGILNLLESGDSIMADKGFTFADWVTLNIPPWKWNSNLNRLNLQKQGGLVPWGSMLKEPLQEWSPFTSSITYPTALLIYIATAVPNKARKLYGCMTRAYMWTIAYYFTTQEHLLPYWAKSADPFLI